MDILRGIIMIRKLSALRSLVERTYDKYDDYEDEEIKFSRVNVVRYNRILSRDTTACYNIKFCDLEHSAANKLSIIDGYHFRLSVIGLCNNNDNGGEHLLHTFEEGDILNVYRHYNSVKPLSKI